VEDDYFCDSPKNNDSSFNTDLSASFQAVKEVSEICTVQAMPCQSSDLDFNKKAFLALQLPLYPTERSASAFSFNKSTGSAFLTI
jgi:hypothetical protein